MRKSMIILAAALGLSFVSVSASAQSPMAEGEVMKVDPSAGKITIKHGPIKKLDMDEGMTNSALPRRRPRHARAGQEGRQDQVRRGQGQRTVHRHEDREGEVVVCRHQF